MRYGRIPEQIAAVGDRVRIIDAEYCEFGHNRNMDAYVGMEAVVTQYKWDDFSGRYAYILDIDNGEYSWCNRCIERIEDVDIEESDANVTDLFA